LHLTDNEKQTITQAIRDVESGCEAELVTVICQRSDDYYYIPTLWAALVALSFPGILSIAGVSLANEYERFAFNRKKHRHFIICIPR